MNLRATAAFLAMTLLAACATTTVYFQDFDGAADGAVPDGWDPAETNSRGTPGDWETASAEGRRFVRLARTANREQTYNLLFAPGDFPADVEIAVRVRADSGEEDQGGGVFWRAGGAGNYYITRWNPLEKNLRAYKVVEGKRTMLASADVDAPPGWHQLGVRMQGARAEVWFDGIVLRFEDEAHADGGGVGLWTKADAATSFDDFSVTPG